MKKIRLSCLFIIILTLGLLILPTNTIAASTKVYNMNNFSVYKGRSKTDIVKKFSSAAPSNYSSTLFKTKSSEKPTYKEATLTDTTKKNALNLSNYYRWLAGLTTLKSSSSTVWTNASKGAVLLAASEFSHTPSKPSKMSKAFYDAAYKATSSSSIAYNYSTNQYKLTDTIRQFLDDEGFATPGHRNTFFTRNATKIAYGISSKYLCQTVEYKDNPNPVGTAVVNNNQASYAWPAPGYFPAEEISTKAYWSINLNIDKLKENNKGAEITIKDLNTGKKYTRKGKDIYFTYYWGYYLSFAPPSNSGSSYKGKKYKVTVTNLVDQNGTPATLEYTINFFSYKSDTYTINGKKYKCNEYGKLTKVTSISSKKAKLSYTSKTYTGKALKPSVKISGLKKDKDYTVTYKNNKNPGKATVTIKGKGKYTGTITKTFTIKPKAVKITSISSKSKKATVKWSKVTGATGYRIYMAKSKNGKYTKIKDTKTLKYTKTKLKKGKTYYFKVRAYKTVGKTKIYGSYSKVKNIKVK